MKRFAPLAALVAALAAAPVSAQQLMAWPLGTATNVWRAILPRNPAQLPHPRVWASPPAAPLFPANAAPVTMSAYRVEGTVTDTVAELTYRISFHNPTDARLEGMLMVPIPADTALSGFSMTVGGKETKGELIESGEAASIYENIVRQARDPGLLELVGERMFRARVFPIEPRGTIVATLKVTQTLPQSGGLVSLRVPMRALRAASEGADKSSARIELRTTRPLRSLFAPNPDVKIERRGEREAVATFEEASGGSSDLALMFSLQQDPLSAGVLAYRESGEDGTFMLSLSPKVQDAAAKAAPKDVVFVLDRSGSMSDDGKMEQAKKALSYCVSRLSENDRFGIVDFATDWSALEERLLPGDAANKARAQRYIAGLDAAGGTNIEAGLGEGLKLLDGGGEGRVPMLFFLTDGVPTQGLTDVNALLARVAAANSGVKARLFSFGVGSDVNTLLLDKLSDGGRGARDYVAPGEDIEAKVSSLYRKVSRPALTDVKIEWRGVETADVYPRPVPDLFSGSELTLYGRYRSGGKGTLVVSGKSAGHHVRFEYPLDLPEAEPKNSFLPRLWAGQKIGHELDALRLAGGPLDAETVASIVKLAKKYGIVTPYTSFLVTEEGSDPRAMRRQSLRDFGALSSAAASSGFSGGLDAAKAARRDSMNLAALSGGMASARGASMAAAVQESEVEARAELRKEGRAAVETRTIGDKTFYKRGSAWVDGDAETDEAKGAKAVTLKARGAEYFDLLAKAPGLARCLALGDDVTVLWGGTVYKIVAD